MSNNIINQDLHSIIEGSDLPWKKLEGKTILITGANGFIASYLIRTIFRLNETMLSNKAHVIGLVRNVSKLRSVFPNITERNDFSIYQHDLAIPFNIDNKIDYILHAASQASSKYFSSDPVGTLKTNTIGTASLLDLARKSGIVKFLFFSSGEVYGNLDHLDKSIDETFNGNVNMLDVRSCYGESKRLGENMCVCWNHQYKIPFNIVRVGYTYGPGLPLSDDRIVAAFVKNVLTNQDMVLYSDGSQRRSFCYISDMVEAIFRILLIGEPGEVYNAASDIQTSMLELATILASLYPEKQLKVIFSKIGFSENYLQSKRINTLVNTDKIKKLGWKRKIDLETGFRRMVQSYI